MIFLALGAAILAILAWVGRRPGRLGYLGRANLTRMAVGALAVAAAAASVFEVVRGQWLGSGILLSLALYMAQATRAPKPKLAGDGEATTDDMSLSQARSILGVGPEASAADIQAAYLRLIQRVHPDRGGAPGLAAQLNAARDRLMRTAV
ncbi:MAG TPA: molecular chaperone DnaJ [Caulobacteraceae bacterium]